MLGILPSPTSCSPFTTRQHGDHSHWAAGKWPTPLSTGLVCPLAGDKHRWEGPSPAESPAAHPAARSAHGARTGRQAPAVATCCSRRMLHILLWGKCNFFFLCFFCVTVHVASVGVCAHTGVCVCVCARRCVSSFPVFQFMQKRRCVFNLLQ